MPPKGLKGYRPNCVWGGMGNILFVKYVCIVWIVALNIYLNKQKNHNGKKDHQNKYKTNLGVSHGSTINKHGGLNLTESRGPLFTGQLEDQKCFLSLSLSRSCPLLKKWQWLLWTGFGCFQKGCSPFYELLCW